MTATTRRTRVSAALLAVLLAGPLAACGTGPPTDELQVVEDPSAARAPDSPGTTVEPAGSVPAPDAGPVTELAVHPASRTLVAAVAEPASLRLYDLDDPGADPTRVALPGAAGELTVTDGAVLVPVPGADVLARVTLPDGELDTTEVRGGPSGAAVDDTGRTLVALADRAAVAVVSDGRVTDTVEGGLYSADDVLIADGDPYVLDRERTALFGVDVDGDEFRGGLRAGHGATNAVVDDFGRILVADTRGGGLLAFSPDPFLLRQRYPVPAGPHGLAYDPTTDVAWVTLPRRNEVVGFDMRGGEPEERYRYPTVRQPDSVTVDPRTSRVVVGSAAGEGIQVIEP